MKPTSGIISMAIEEALLSPHRFRIGAVIYKKSHPLGSGHNERLKTHTRSPHPFKSIHAEFAAVMNSVERNGRWELSNYCSIYVHRLKLDGSSGLSKPCQWCDKMLAQLGIKDVHWSV